MQSTDFIYGYARDLMEEDYPKAETNIQKLKILIEAKTLFSYVVLDEGYCLSEYRINELIEEIEKLIEQTYNDGFEKGYSEGYANSFLDN